MYSSTKHGVRGFSGSLFEDVREAGIKVCNISPGYVNTEMHKGSSHLDAEKMIQPKDIAETVKFVIDFPENACPTEITILPQKSPRRDRR